jgi:hypothetical protein
MMRNYLAICIAFAVATLSGCADQSGMMGFGGSGAGKTAEERQLEQQVSGLTEVSRNIVTANTLQGAAFGAAAGCGIALLFGGEGKDCLIGGAAGGVVGGVAGNQVGQQAAAANVEMVQQDQIIANLHQVNAKLDTVAASLRNVIASQNAEMTSLRGQLASQQISRESYDARIAAIASNRKTVAQGLEASQSNMAQSDEQLASLEQNGENLGGQRAAVMSTRNRLATLQQSVALVPSE